MTGIDTAIRLAHKVQEECFNNNPSDKLLSLTDSLILMLSDIKEERERDEDIARCYGSEEEEQEEADEGEES
jgi:hypothetical protein